MSSNPVVAFIEVLAMIAFIGGAIGLIVSFVRPIQRRFWIILFAAGIVVMWIFTAAFPAEEEETEEAVVEAIVEEEEETAAEAAARTASEMAAQIAAETAAADATTADEGVVAAVTEEGIDEGIAEEDAFVSPEDASRTISTQSNEFWTMTENADITITLVAGDEKSITLRFENTIPDCTYDMCSFTQINLGGHLTYLADEDNGFTGISLSTRYNGEDWPRFFSYTSLVQGGYCEIEYYMGDGSDLPDTMTFIFDEMEQYWRQDGSIDTYNIEGLTIELQRSGTV